MNKSEYLLHSAGSLLFVLFDVVNKIIKEKFRIHRTGRGLGVELRREEGFCFVTNPFIGLIIHVHKHWFPVIRQGIVVDGKTVVL